MAVSPPENNRAAFDDVTAHDLEQARAVLAGVPRAPRVPSKGARKRVLAFAGPQLGVLVGSLIALLPGLVISVYFEAHRPVMDQLLDMGSTEATGIVDSVEVGGRVRGGGFVYCARFHTEDGDLRGRSCSPEVKFQPGARVPVELRGQYARIRGTTLSPLGRVGAVLLLFPLLGGVALLSVVWANRRESRAARIGIPILARVTYFGDGKSMRRDQPPPTELRWSFIVRGERYEGRLALNHASEFDFLPSRHVIVALYDPAAPGTNTVYVP